MKKASKNQVLLLIALLGVLAVVISYFFVYKTNVEKAEAQEAQNETLAAEVARLQTLYENMPTYIEQTNKMNTENKEFESEFPVDILPEDSIMMVETMEESTETEISSVSFGGTLAVPYTVEAASTEGDTSEAAGTSSVVSVDALPAEMQNVVIYDTTMYEVPLSLSIDCTYDEFKKLVTYIYSQNDRMSISGVSLGFNNENGMLTGSLTMKQYYLLGTDKLYTDTYIPNMKMGIDNIFGDIVE